MHMHTRRSICPEETSKDLLHYILVSFRNGLSEKVTDPRDHDMYGA